MIPIACVVSVSVRFRSKETGTRVKDRAFVKLIQAKINENTVAFLFTLTLILKMLFNIYM